MRYFGEVVEDTTNDPLECGRIRVWVRGVHAPAMYSTPGILPWAIVVASPANAGVAGGGMPELAIEAGAQVYVDFADEDKQYPVVLGVVPRLDNYEAAISAAGTDRIDYGGNAGGGYDGRRDMGGSPGGNSYTVKPGALYKFPDWESPIGSGKVDPGRMWRDLVRWLVNDQDVPGGVEHAKNVAAGILGNVRMESNWSASVVAGYGGTGAYGLFQWMASRKRDLITFCSGSNMNAADTYEGQFQFFLNENLGKEKSAWTKTVKYGSTPGKSAAIFAVWWERTDGTYKTGAGQDIWRNSITNFLRMAEDKYEVTKLSTMSSAHMNERREAAYQYYYQYKDMPIKGIDFNNPLSPTQGAQ